MRRNKGRDFFVKIKLPVHALGNRFDDQVAFLQLFQMLFVIGLANQHSIVRHTQGRGFELFQTVHRAGDDTVLGPLLGGQVKQDDRHLDIGQVRRNLRAHHPCAKNGDFFHIETRHVLTPLGPSLSKPLNTF